MFLTQLCDHKIASEVALKRPMCDPYFLSIAENVYGCLVSHLEPKLTRRQDCPTNCLRGKRLYLHYECKHPDGWLRVDFEKYLVV